MKQYWPRAVALNPAFEPLALCSTGSFPTLEEAEEVFKFWQTSYGYTILTSWVECDNKIVSHRCYVNTLGQITRL